MAGPGFDEFFAAHYDDLARTLTVALGDRAAAEEAAQEALARALKHWRRVRQMDQPRNWLYVVAMNHVRDGWRRAKRQPRWDPGAAPGPDLSGRIATTVSVRDAIATL